MFGNLVIEPQFPYLIIHKATGLAMEICEGNNSQAISVELGPKNQKNIQQLWFIRRQGDQGHLIINASTNKALTIDHNQLNLRSLTGLGNEHWNIDTTIPGKVCIRSKNHHKKTYLTQKIKKIVTEEEKDKKNEEIDEWKFQKVQNNQLVNNSCLIQSVDNHKFIDVPKSKNPEGVRISLANGNYGFNQRWCLYAAGQVYVIKSLLNQFNLNIKNQSQNSGTKIVLWHSDGGKQQFWRLQKKEQDTYRITSWLQPSLEIGYSGLNLVTFKGQKFKWRIHGFIPN